MLIKKKKEQQLALRESIRKQKRFKKDSKSESKINSHSNLRLFDNP